MGRLTGFHYRDVVRQLKVFGFVFDRQAAGSHEIWFNKSTIFYFHYGRTFNTVFENFVYHDQCQMLRSDPFIFSKIY
ncbi:type II toxin-antitoxin system HicA family toxin [Patescibacteria group bacterium]|nr:type II toxin-antitoxin system HicA family toxin [Patescibacteria group bacterium]